MKRDEIPELLKGLPEDARIISHSQAQTWSDCRHKWRMTYLEDWKPKTTKGFFTQGHQVHSLLELAYESLKNYDFPEPTAHIIAEMEAWIKSKMVESSYEELNLLASSGRLVKRYVKEVLPKDMKDYTTLDTEYHFVVKLKTPNGYEFYLQGYVDWIGKNNKTGRIEFMDHKTHGGRAWSEAQVQMDTQLPIYNAALRLLGMDVARFHVNMLNTYDYKKFDEAKTEQLFKRMSSYRTDKELDYALTHLGRIVDEIIQAEQYISMDPKWGDPPDVVYRKNLRKECASCWFQESCLMEMKGIDPKPFLLTKFRQGDRNNPVEEVLDLAMEVE